MSSCHADETFRIDFGIVGEVEMAVDRTLALAGGAAGEEPYRRIVLARRPGRRGGGCGSGDQASKPGRPGASPTRMTEPGSWQCRAWACRLEASRTGLVDEGVRLHASRDSGNDRRPAASGLIWVTTAPTSAPEPGINEFRAVAHAEQHALLGQRPMRGALGTTCVTLAATSSVSPGPREWGGLRPRPAATFANTE